jgi:hypothetical protein
MRNRNFCYYHLHWRPAVVNLCQPGKKAHFTLPILEDAHSIQFAITQVMHQLIDKTIDAKTAGLMFYGLQIASSNLRQLNAETPQPSQVVVDEDQVLDATVETAPNPQTNPDSQKQNIGKSNKKREPSEAEIQRQLDYLLYIGQHLDEPAGNDPEEETLKILADTKDEDMEALQENIHSLTNELEAEFEAKREQKPDGNLPSGTIQACISTSRNERNLRRIN